jgi:hypothetical protein
MGVKNLILSRPLMGVTQISELHTSASWLAKAEEVRTKAESMPDVSFRQMMLEIATAYEVLARQVEFVEATQPLLDPKDAVSSDLADTRPASSRPYFPNQIRPGHPAAIADVIEAARRALAAVDQARCALSSMKVPASLRKTVMS